MMITSVSASDLPPPTLSFHGEINDPQCFAQVDMTTGRLFMRDHTGGLAESYDWERFGKIAYQAITGRKLPSASLSSKGLPCLERCGPFADCDGVDYCEVCGFCRGASRRSGL